MHIAVIPSQGRPTILSVLLSALLFAAAAACSLAPASAAETAPAPSQAPSASARLPNIVFILADDLGINDLGCYGRTEHHTPCIDRLASEGVRFEASYCAQPICSPSRAAILIGKAPARLHLTTYLPGRPDAASQKLLHPTIRQELPLEEETLAEILKRAGYATACIGKWHLGGRGFGPENQGFDVVFEGRSQTKPSAAEGAKGEYELTERALKFIEANRERPFFLYLAHYTPHIPLGAQGPRIEKNKEAFHPVYAAMVETLDDCVGRVESRLRELTLADQTILVFTSDNGGLHVPEGRDDPPTHNSPFRAGKGFLHEGGLRVPLIIRWPGHIPAGKVSRDPIVNTDHLPTLLELLGLPAPAGLDGSSFAPVLTGAQTSQTVQAPQPRRLFWHFPHYTNQGSRPEGAVRDGRWKLVEQYEDGRAELFDLDVDPGETSDLSAQHGDRVAELKAALAEWRRSVGAQENTQNPGFDPALQRRIYIDVDVSRLKPGARAAGMTPGLAAWRQAMNAAASGKAALPRPLVPEMEGAWWRIAGKPDLGTLGKPDEEPVDFAIWRAEDGTWQLLSCIRKTAEAGHTRLFHRWESADIAAGDWKPVGIALRADPRRGEQPGGLQAPHVVKVGERYIMAYGDWERICLASSRDGKEFTPVLDAAGSSGLFGEGPGANTRDPMLLRVGQLWHCYYTAAPDGRGAVFARTSPDLRSWSLRTLVHIGGRGGEGPWSAECPHVVERQGFFYLFRTQYYGRGNISHVYRSRDPLDFGVGRPEDSSWVASLPVAAPEIVVDGDREYMAALEPGLDGIRLVRLRWVADGGGR